MEEVQVDCTVDIGEMYLEQNIPVLVVTTVLVQTIPPEPIASFSDVQTFHAASRPEWFGLSSSNN